MITAITASNLKPGKTIADGDGLYLRCLKNGRKSWVVKKSVSGKIHTATIGAYPDMTITNARAAARDLIARLTLSKTKEQTIPSFGKVIEEWLNFKAPQVTDVGKIACRMKLLRALNDIPFNEVTTLDVATIIKQYTRNGSTRLESAQRLAMWLRQCELYALNSGYCENLKFQGLTALIPSHKREHRPSISPTELPETLATLYKRSRRGAPVLWWSLLVGLYTLLRPGEYTSMQWDWVKKDVIVVPAEFMKMKITHKVPITPQLRAVLNDLKRVKVSEFVLPSPVKVSTHITPDSLEKFLRNSGFRGVLVPHGFRSIGRTWMRENGIAHDVAEMCLAHAVGSAVERAYNRADLMQERRQAMERWCDFVSQCSESPLC